MLFLVQRLVNCFFCVFLDAFPDQLSRTVNFQLQSEYLCFRGVRIQKLTDRFPIPSKYAFLIGKHIVKFFYKCFLNILLINVRRDEFFFTFIFIVTLPYRPAVFFIVRVPYFSAIEAATIPTDDFPEKNIVTGFISRYILPHIHFLLYQVVNFRGNYRRVAVFLHNIVLLRPRSFFVF